MVTWISRCGMWSENILVFERKKQIFTWIGSQQIANTNTTMTTMRVTRRFPFLQSAPLLFVVRGDFFVGAHEINNAQPVVGRRFYGWQQAAW